MRQKLALGGGFYIFFTTPIQPDNKLLEDR